MSSMTDTYCSSGLSLNPQANTFDTDIYGINRILLENHSCLKSLTGL